MAIHSIFFKTKNKMKSHLLETIYTTTHTTRKLDVVEKIEVSPKKESVIPCRYLLVQILQ